MRDLRQLLRIAARRNAADDYTQVRFRVLRRIADSFRRKTHEDMISGNVVIEACLQGYLNSHPAVLAMIDQWIRDNMPEAEETRRVPTMTKRDLEEIYSASRLMMFDGPERDEEDG